MGKYEESRVFGKEETAMKRRPTRVIIAQTPLTRKETASCETPKYHNEPVRHMDERDTVETV